MLKATRRTTRFCDRLGTIENRRRAGRRRREITFVPPLLCLPGEKPKKRNLCHEEAYWEKRRREREGDSVRNTLHQSNAEANSWSGALERLPSNCKVLLVVRSTVLPYAFPTEGDRIIDGQILFYRPRQNRGSNPRPRERGGIYYTFLYYY